MYSSRLTARRIPHNPLHKAFKAKSFTDKDITLHFYVMDLLADGSALSSREIVDCINDDYLSHFSGAFSPDESTVRKKLKEYEALGLLSSEKCGREVLYRRTDDNTVDLNTWADALSFFSEEDPLGVIGSFLIDKLENLLIASDSNITTCSTPWTVMSSVICWRQSMKKSCGTDRQEPAEWPRLSKDGLSSEDLCQHPVRAPVSARLPLPGAALIFLPVGCHQKGHDWECRETLQQVLRVPGEV